MKRWYVIQVYAGYEENVKADLTMRIKEEGMQDHFGEVLIPSATLKSLFAAEQSKDEQLVPGYILIEMDATVPGVVRLVASTPRVTRFLGGKDPIPLSKKEIDRIISQMKGEVVVAQEKREFALGKEVDIVDGPFAGFVGIIDKVDDENERLSVMVSIFGRMTPIELGFNQVKQ
ncbi:MAG TPA: transcription termination/antitermination protein NusG [Candidatus Limnocylindria bacterium]|nr:transcription termination/antitermination protein NusG [Candidatus Limnocylindria bacterium]